MIICLLYEFTQVGGAMCEGCTKVKNKCLSSPASLYQNIPPVSVCFTLVSPTSRLYTGCLQGDAARRHPHYVPKQTVNFFQCMELNVITEVLPNCLASLEPERSCEEMFSWLLVLLAVLLFK